MRAATWPARRVLGRRSPLSVRLSASLPGRRRAAQAAYVPLEHVALAPDQGTAPVRYSARLALVQQPLVRDVVNEGDLRIPPFIRVDKRRAVSASNRELLRQGGLR